MFPMPKFIGELIFLLCSLCSFSGRNLSGKMGPLPSHFQTKRESVDTRCSICKRPIIINGTIVVANTTPMYLNGITLKTANSGTNSFTHLRRLTEFNDQVQIWSWM